METSANPEERRRKCGQISNGVSRKPRASMPNVTDRSYTPPKDLLSRMTSDPGHPRKSGISQHGKNSTGQLIGPFEDPPLSPDAQYDISGQTSENRFPWLKDQGTQCSMNSETASAANSAVKPRPVSELVTAEDLKQMSRPNRSMSHSAM